MAIILQIIGDSVVSRGICSSGVYSGDGGAGRKYLGSGCILKVVLTGPNGALDTEAVG